MTLKHLTSLTLSENRLGGKIPKEIGHLTKLNSLQLHENRFSGHIPNEVSNLLELTTRKKSLI
jgi:hypothetical protein